MGVMSRHDGFCLEHCRDIRSAMCAAVGPCHRKCPERAFVSLSPNGELRKTYRERRLMAFTPREVFDVVADVGKYEEFVPWCQKSFVTKQIDAEHFEAELEVGFKIFNERYISRVSLQEPCLVTSEAADTQVFNHLINRWELARGPTAKSTWLTFTVDFSFRNPLYGQTASLFFDQVVTKMIEAFNNRCHDVYSAKRRRQVA